MRNIEFVQTWDLEETITFLEQCDEGYDETPKLRVFPKRYPEVSTEQNILMIFSKVGKVTSENILKEYGSLSNLITILRNMNEDEAKKHPILYKMWKVFH